MKKTENSTGKNKILGGSATVLNVIVILAAWGLGRVYPLPVGILAAIYFAVMLGITINKYNGVKESGGDVSGLKKERQSYIVWLVIVAAVIGFNVWSLGGLEPNSISTGTQTPSELASQGAREAKSSTTLPYELDEVTTLTDITSEGSAIQYHYVIHDADTSNLSTATLRNSVQPSVCANTSTKQLLNAGVNMRYNYAVKETGQAISFTIANSDC